MKFTKAALTALTLSSFAFGAQATFINPIGGDGPDSDLQTILNNYTVGSDFYDVSDGAGNQAQTDGAWTTGSTDVSTFKLVFELAGNSNINSFGLYDVNNTANTLEVFAGGDSPVTTDVVFNLTPGDFGNISLSGGAGDTATFSSNAFGFYLSNGSSTFYSIVTDNSDNGDYMVGFEGDGSLTLNPANPKSFLANEFLFAWEDTAIASSDLDYNDFIVIAESVTQVPTPATLALFGLGLLGMGAVARKRKQS